MQGREVAIGQIMAACRYSREEVEDLLVVWAEAKGLNFTDYVPEADIDEIIEILHEEMQYVS
jgi:hypothetical protein